ncbi:carbohydrate ABC transporter permease [Devosia sp.]|uniref:carbohydrate ABC transporter permease n=1 Tax=Devosia sp. TaxID=1871048 RepID=UPI001B2ADE70|nr:carbohydrate ABC transporter permease [Devosia sp.]MBO9590278.1 carbohydrate ABC transporter permease [Devosia sp.]
MAIVGKTSSSRSFRVSRNMLTALMVLFILYSFAPIVYVLLSSTKSNADLFTTFGFWFGNSFALWDNLQLVFAYQNSIFSTWLWNSFVYSTTIAVGAALLSTWAAYAFSKYEFRGKKAIFATVLGAVMIPQTALVVPLFLLVTSMGLVNTPWAFILPSMVSPFGVYLMKSYIDESVPSELIDAARVDGASEFRIFWSIAFRLMAPGFSTVVLLNFVWSWNNYFLPLVVLSSSNTLPVTVGLAQWYKLGGGAGGAILYSIVLTGAVVSIVPVVILFLFMQRYWLGGLTTGSVKA